MGNAQSIEENEVARSRPGDWSVVGEGYNCQIVESQSLRIRAEQYRVPLNEKTWDINNIKIHEFRRVQTSHLVKVYNVQNNGEEMIVRTELVPYRLADITNLTPDQALYVALYSLIGFRYVYELCQRRLFSISDSMIGFTPDGHVKVWINPNYSVNQLDQDTFRANPIKAEHEMANLILAIVAKHTSGGKLSQRFLQQFHSKPQRTITDTLRCFKAFLQSQNVLIASQINFTGKVTIDTSKAHGYFQKPETIIQDQPIHTLPASNPLISSIPQNEGQPQQPQEPLGKLYASGNLQNPYQFPQVPNAQQIHQRIPRPQFIQQQGSNSHYVQSGIHPIQNTSFVQSNGSLGHNSQISANRSILKNTFGSQRNVVQQQVQPGSVRVGPRDPRISNLSVPIRGGYPPQNQFYTRQGTNNYPIPSTAINNVNIQRPHVGNIRAVQPHYHQPVQQKHRYTPVSQAQLAPAVGVMSKVTDVVRFEPIKIQEGKITQHELRTQKQIGQAMNPHSNSNNINYNPEANKHVNFIQLSSYEQINKQRALTSQDYISGEQRDLGFVNPQIRKLMLFKKDTVEQVHYDNSFNMKQSNVDSNYINNIRANNFTANNQTAYNGISDQYRSNVSQPVKRSNASSLSYKSKSNLSSLSKRSNRSFKADKVILVGGRPVQSNPIEITEVQSETGPSKRTQVTVYHQMSSFGLQPIIKQESPYSYDMPQQRKKLSAPKSPYSQPNAYSGVFNNQTSNFVHSATYN